MLGLHQLRALHCAVQFILETCLPKFASAGVKHRDNSRTSPELMSRDSKGASVFPDLGLDRAKEIFLRPARLRHRFFRPRIDGALRPG